MGRPPLGKRPMTAAQRSKNRRDRKEAMVNRMREALRAVVSARTLATAQRIAAAQLKEGDNEQ